MAARLLVVDSYPLVYRSYHGIAKSMVMTRADGRPTAALYGYTKALMAAIATIKPTHMLVALDSSGPTVRHTMYPPYKAGRPEVPDDLRWQISQIRSFTERIGLACSGVQGYEADDIIGSAVHAWRETFPESEAVILTPDKDLLQLVCERGPITSLRPINYKRRVKGTSGPHGLEGFEIMGTNEVWSKLGIRPDQMVDYLALTGDVADNIPGIKGIGDKTASRLLQHYGSLASMRRLHSQGGLVGSKVSGVSAKRIELIGADLDKGNAEWGPAATIDGAEAEVTTRHAGAEAAVSLPTGSLALISHDLVRLRPVPGLPPVEEMVLCTHDLQASALPGGALSQFEFHSIVKHVHEIVSDRQRMDNNFNS